jgi:hypothetical protein
MSGAFWVDVCCRKVQEGSEVFGKLPGRVWGFEWRVRRGKYKVVQI